MTRFVYVADTHVGACPMGYHQQAAYPEQLPDILATLDAWIEQAGNIDFVLHGGDMVDTAGEDMLRHAAEIFRLPIPVYLCLGNHDLTDRDSLRNWLRLAPEIFPGGTPEYAIETDECVIHVVPNHWCDTPYHWRDVQDPHFTPDQLAALEKALATPTEAAHILLTHSPVFGLPPEQTGLNEPLHSPGQAFGSCVVSLAAAHPQIDCVLGAHNHMNMNVERARVNYVTVSALVETPFEFKLFEIDRESISMTTIALADRLPFAAEYDVDKAFVQGKGAVRNFSRKRSATRASA